MKSSTKDAIGALIVWSVIALVIFGVPCAAWHDGYDEGREDFAKEAVTQGFADWVPSEGGEPVFRWKERE